MQQDEQLDLAQHNGADHDHKEECDCGCDCSKNDGAECGCNCETKAEETVTPGNEPLPEMCWNEGETQKVLGFPHVTMPETMQDRVVMIGYVPEDFDLNAFIDENLLEERESADGFTFDFKEGPLRWFRMPADVRENREAIGRYLFDHPCLEAFIREGLKHAEVQLRNQWHTQAAQLKAVYDYVQPVFETAALSPEEMAHKAAVETVTAYVKNPDNFADELVNLFGDGIVTESFLVNVSPDCTGFGLIYFTPATPAVGFQMTVWAEDGSFKVDVVKQVAGADIEYIVQAGDASAYFISIADALGNVIKEVAEETDAA